MPPAIPTPPDPLHELQSRYDGPLPPVARVVALAGGPDRLAAVHRDAARRLCAERCGRAWQAVTLRRTALTARHVKRDPWLKRLVAGLMEARMQALEMETIRLAGNLRIG
jgi:hypothetical protein